MKRRSRTPFVILGFLIHEPRSGYDLKATIEGTVGHFWQESYGQLYPTLKRLHADGLVTMNEEGEGARPRKLYGITPEGQAAFSAWLSEPAQPTTARNETLLKVFMASLGDAADLRPHLEAARASAQERLSTLHGIRAAVTAEEGPTQHQKRCWLLTVDLGLRGAQAGLDWATEALAELDADVR
ncbi:MAG: PadR family transcriptional regulator AphA [Myxococcota bacterium]|jgi:PadR family transcriptional regulator AphA